MTVGIIFVKVMKINSALSIVFLQILMKNITFCWKTSFFKKFSSENFKKSTESEENIFVTFTKITPCERKKMQKFNFGV